MTRLEGDAPRARTDGRPGEFPATFLFGAATAAYQIEGATTEDGRGPSIWDTFCCVEGAIHDGHTGEIAADHYHRYRDDIAILRQLGLGAYRFSVAWSRVQPDGRGRLNQRGLDFYRRLIAALRHSGIEPWVTLYHWDLPQPLEDAGGWPVRDTAERFAEYAAMVHQLLGADVRYWTTLNEPWCSAFLGYASGDHAPGRREPRAAVAAAHHLLLGHGLAVQAIRAGDRDADIGLTLNLYPVDPATRGPEDVDAARRIDGLSNRLFLEPLLEGRYPADVLEDLAGARLQLPVRDGDLSTIAAPMDMLGVNYYTRHVVAARRRDTAQAQRMAAYPGAEHVAFVSTGKPQTAMGWELDAKGLVDVLRRVHRDYPKLPLYVTENGAAYADVLSSDRAVHDRDRCDYLHRHLEAALAALAEGIPLRGYFVWSLLDNFEWAFGYSMRFGIVRVDYATQQRTIKDSGRWYAEIARTRRLRRPAAEGGSPTDGRSSEALSQT